jgi:hypothetical protein
MRKASIAFGTIALATAGSAVFGGVALASCHDGCNSHHNSHHNDHHHSSGDHNTRGGDGVGGDATNNCLNVGIPILSGLGVGGSGDAGGAGCVASADGSGGNAY